MLPITTLTTAFLSLFHVWLAFQVIHLRRRLRVSMGDGGHQELTRAIRAHGNCAEYLPISLILLGLVELQRGHPWVLGAFAALIITGRVLHAMAFLRETAHLPRRVRGMQCTFIAIIGLALYAVGLVGSAWLR